MLHGYLLCNHCTFIITLFARIPMAHTYCLLSALRCTGMHQCANASISGKKIICNGENVNHLSMLQLFILFLNPQTARIENLKRICSFRHVPEPTFEKHCILNVTVESLVLNLFLKDLGTSIATENYHVRILSSITLTQLIALV